MIAIDRGCDAWYTDRFSDTGKMKRSSRENDLSGGADRLIFWLGTIHLARIICRLFPIDTENAS